MGKKFKSTKKYLQPDPIYNDVLASKFINSIMLDGKKSLAQKIFYDCMQMLKKQFKNNEEAKKAEEKGIALELGVFRTAINNVKPDIEVRSRRVGGATYQVPVEVEKGRQISLAFRWIMAAARDRKGKPMAQKLAEELSDAFKKQGKSITVRENVHKMAEANKAFAHFAW